MERQAQNKMHCNGFVLLFSLVFSISVSIPVTEGSPSLVREAVEIPTEFSTETKNFEGSHRKERMNKPLQSHLVHEDITGVARHVVQLANGTSESEITLWTKGIIPYTIARDFSKAHRQIFKTVMDYLHETTCLKFVPRKKQKNFLKIVSTTEHTCSSAMGMVDDGDAQLLSLNKEECMTKTVVGHEMMHAIGFNHEQSRPDRNKFVKVFVKNIADPTDAHNFAIEPQNYINVGMPYDILSIMQYSSYLFSKEPEEEHPTILTKKGGEIKEREFYSKGDIQEINRLYKKECQKRKM